MTTDNARHAADILKRMRDTTYRVQVDIGPTYEERPYYGPSTRAALTKAITALEREAQPRDKCALCLGHKGGVPGNENVIDGVVVCDYCTVTLHGMRDTRDAHRPTMGSTNVKECRRCKKPCHKGSHDCECQTCWGDEATI